MDKYIRENLNSNFIKKYPLIFKKYRPLKKIASGSFSEIYSGVNIINNEKVAIKIEKRNIKNKYLESECYTLFSLKNIGIPRVLSFGHNKEYDILVMPLLGKSLLDIFVSKNLNYEFKDICLLAIQIIERIQWVHSKKIIHRDIKPDNFLIGLNDPHIVYLIDFGLSKKYKSTKTGKHISISESKKFTGTIVYGSVNSLKCREQSRRDDLESIGYMLIYFMKGSLPWQSVKVDNKKDSYLRMSQMKKSILPEILCNNLPREFADYMKYVKNLKFEEDPNYGYLRDLFVQLMKKQGFEEGTCFFSWININSINIRTIKRQINLSKRSSSRKRVINKIRRALEKSNKSYSENKHDYFYHIKGICNNNNENDNYYNNNDETNENNKFFINTKVKKYVDKIYTNQKQINIKSKSNFDFTNTLDETNKKDISLEKTYKGNINNIEKNNLISINNNIVKRNNKNLVTSPLTYGQKDLKINNYILTENNLYNNSNNYNNYNYAYNVTNTIYTQKISTNSTNANNNNDFRILNPIKKNTNLISSYNSHKRISSNNFPNKVKKFPNHKVLNNNSNSYIYKKKNIIIINNNIYPSPNNGVCYNNTLDNNNKINYIPQKKDNPTYNNIKIKRNKNINDRNLRSIKLFNLFSPKKKKQSITIPVNNNNKINNDIMKEIKIFNKRYNYNQNIYDNKIEHDNVTKKIKIPKNIHTTKSSDNKKGFIYKNIRNRFHSPRNNNCNIF